MRTTGGGGGNAALVTAILSACALAAGAVMTSEGWETTPYKDTNGVWTVCGGETKGVDPHKTYTQSDCLQMFTASLVQHGTDISRCLPENLPDDVRASFTDTAYNIGATSFCKSSMSRLAKAGDLKGACAAISLYVYVGKKDCRIQSNNCYGIVDRRARERKQCQKGLT